MELSEILIANKYIMVFRSNIVIKYKEAIACAEFKRMRYIVCLSYAFCKAMFEPYMSSLVPGPANDTDQGKRRGSYLLLQSLTWVVGPVTAACFYNIHKDLPHLIYVMLTFISIIFFLRLKKVQFI